LEAQVNTHLTDTSKWALAIHRVTKNSVEIWVGTLFPTMAMPLKARVKLVTPDGRTRTRNISKSNWKRPFSKTRKRFYTLVNFSQLHSGTQYKVEFHRHIEATEGLISAEWQHLRSGQFDTLPERVKAKNLPKMDFTRPFKISLK
jgi:hypothetical protein